MSDQVVRRDESILVWISVFCLSSERAVHDKPVTDVAETTLIIPLGRPVFTSQYSNHKISVPFRRTPLTHQ
jgi:hypothetical protein